MGSILPDRVGIVLLASFPAGPWQTNCYVAATEPGSECVIIDPGYQASVQVDEIVAEYRLTPVAVLTTHGHLDHMFSVFDVCARYGVPVWIHPGDRHLLSEPLRGMGADAHGLLLQLTGGPAAFHEPDDVRELTHGGRLRLAGLEFDVVHAPGHTAGSVLFSLAYPPEGAEPDHSGIDALVFSGDVLFAGAIGRTDLPGGDDRTMRGSLLEQVLTLPDSYAVLPGHGPQTTMAAERASNPYLQPHYLEGAL